MDDSCDEEHDQGCGTEGEREGDDESVVSSGVLLARLASLIAPTTDGNPSSVSAAATRYGLICHVIVW
jgi:hypothetical protein